MISDFNFTNWWNIISKLDDSTLEENASSLNHLYGCEEYLGLNKLRDLNYPTLPASDLLLKQPAFINLEQGDLQILRGWLYLGENKPQTSNWAETLLRYAEINQTSLMNKTIAKFQSSKAAWLFLYEMIAFLMDNYFETLDLRFFNICLKLIEMNGPFNTKSITRTLQNHVLYPTLLQVRILIMSETAFRKLGFIDS